MNRRIRLVGITIAATIVAALVLNVGLVVANAQGNGIVASANGHGNLTVGGELRTFSFQANTDSSGTSNGNAELFARAAGVRFHVDINCLSVSGNVATMSGTISSANAAGSGFVGLDAWFKVEDNGHGGSNPPDAITLVLIGSGTPCTADAGLPLLNIDGGNITVH